MDEEIDLGNMTDEMKALHRENAALKKALEQMNEQETLRDKFAMASLKLKHTITSTAKWAYELADAMLAERASR